MSGGLDSEKEEEGEEKKKMLMQRVNGDLGGSISLLLMAVTMTVMTVVMDPGGRTLGSVEFFCGTLDARAAILRARVIVRIMEREKKRKSEESERPLLWYYGVCLSQLQRMCVTEN